jgi:hypothetical protein
MDYQYTSDTPVGRWGLGAVLRDAEGSTGQTASGRRWAEITAIFQLIADEEA